MLPRDFCESGALGNGADGGVGVSEKSSGEETSPRPDTIESLPAVDCRDGLDDVAVGVGDAGTLRALGGLSAGGREEASVGEGKF